MKWTFGIITAGDQWGRVGLVCESIRRESDEDQIIVVGGSKAPIDLVVKYDLLHIPFDESKNKAWITRKKNVIAEIALHDNICLLHDYVALNSGWRAGFEVFGEDWLTCMTPIINQDGKRFRNWCVIYNDAWMVEPIDSQEPPQEHPGRLLDYATRGHERWQYYSGAYFCTKRWVLRDVPLDESRCWGQGEDVQFSRLLYAQFGQDVFKLNTQSSVRFLKQKDQAPWEKLPLL